MKPAPLRPWMLAAVIAVFAAAAAVFSSIAYRAFRVTTEMFRDDDARRHRHERERLLREFDQPCDPESTTFYGQTVAVWLDRIHNGSEFERYKAVLALRSICEEKAPFCLNRRGREAAYELVAAGHRSRRAAVVVPPIAAALDDPAPWVSKTAAIALRDIGPPAVLAIDALRRALHHPDGRTRVLAAEALFAITRQTDEALATMAHVLAHDPAPEYRRFAADSIGSLPDRRGFASLGAALADPDEGVRRRASRARQTLATVASAQR